MQLSRDLSINKNTAWLLQMKIRAAMASGEFEYFKPEKKPFRITLTKVKKPTLEDESTPSLSDHHLWNLLKRAIVGQYHRIDEHYLSRYIDEIQFKYDRRDVQFWGYNELISRALRL